MSIPFTVSGKVVPGAGRGRDLGYPTANIRLSPFARVPDGVFAVTARVPDSADPLEGVGFIGKPKTFADFKRRAEVHVFDFSDDLLGADLTVYFLQLIRSNKTFSSAEALAAAIGEDILAAQRLFDRVPA